MDGQQGKLYEQLELRWSRGGGGEGRGGGGLITARQQQLSPKGRVCREPHESIDQAGAANARVCTHNGTGSWVVHTCTLTFLGKLSAPTGWLAGFVVDADA